MLNCLNLSSVQRTSTSVTKMEPDWNSEASDVQHLCLAHTKTHSSVWINQCLDWKEQTCTLTAGLRALITGYVGKTNTGNCTGECLFTGALPGRKPELASTSGECFTLTLVKRFVLTSRLTVWSSSIELWTGAEQESSREPAGLCGQVTTRCWVLQAQRTTPTHSNSIKQPITTTEADFKYCSLTRRWDWSSAQREQPAHSSTWEKTDSETKRRKENPDGRDRDRTGKSLKCKTVQPEMLNKTRF